MAVDLILIVKSNIIIMINTDKKIISFLFGIFKNSEELTNFRPVLWTEPH